MDGIASVGPFSRTARRIGPIVALLCLALIVDGSARVRRVVAGAGDPVTAGIAAYFPDTAPNRAALTSRPGLGVVVMNTLQAAGSQTAVAEYKGAGKRVFGYMAAGYAPSGANGIAAKSLAQLQATAGTILAAYPTIDGLFLDEVLNNDAAGCAAPSAFYVSFYQWFKSAYAAKSLILNPGTALCASFAGSADMYLVFENRLGFYRSAFVPYFAQTDFDWMRALPNSQVWSIVYGVPLADMPALINELADYAGVVTVLSDNAEHPSRRQRERYAAHGAGPAAPIRRERDAQVIDLQQRFGPIRGAHWKPSSIERATRRSSSARSWTPAGRAPDGIARRKCTKRSRDTASSRSSSASGSAWSSTRRSRNG